MEHFHLDVKRMMPGVAGESLGMDMGILSYLGYLPKGTQNFPLNLSHSDVL